MREDLHSKIKNIQLLALDVDGVLTDGSVYIFEDQKELRRFDIKDGLGLVLLIAAGIRVVWISNSMNMAISHRAKQLKIHEVHLGVSNKLEKMEQICERNGIKLNDVIYMGDDLTDIPVLESVGLACAPADAIETVKQKAAIITGASGGYGAVREICDLLLSAKSRQ